MKISGFVVYINTTPTGINGENQEMNMNIDLRSITDQSLKLITDDRGSLGLKQQDIKNGLSLTIPGLTEYPTQHFHLFFSI